MGSEGMEKSSEAESDSPGASTPAGASRWVFLSYASHDAARDEDLYVIKGDPLLKNLEGDPRYKAFLRKMNLPE